jgi:hypothetical protein
MPINKLRSGLDEQILEGGGAGAGMMAAGRSAGRGPTQTGIASKEANKKATSMADEMIAADKRAVANKELEAAKAKPERQAAERNATVSTEGGVKKTTYPYAGENEYKQGGKVRSASSRADGIATKGKTRGKIVMCGGGMYKK